MKQESKDDSSDDEFTKRKSEEDVLVVVDDVQPKILIRHRRKIKSFTIDELLKPDRCNQDRRSSFPRPKFFPESEGRGGKSEESGQVLNIAGHEKEESFKESPGKRRHFPICHIPCCSSNQH
ncbi:unnamed protein product [Allacma fusca]|uniref:Uncharacterized protein n=1 Tax=Allacma fusca TaxID=39272 RepID=A0A8J2PIA1_9HEXA|nr:unnamed protein product [Allacma fusca]